MTGFEPAEEPLGLPIHNWKPKDEAPAVSKPALKRGKKVLTTKQRVKRSMVKITAGLAVATIGTLYAVNAIGNFYDHKITYLQSPIVLRSPVVVKDRQPITLPQSPAPDVQPVKTESKPVTIIPVAHAEELPKAGTITTVEQNYAEFEKQAEGKLTSKQAAQLKLIGECESGFQMKPSNVPGSSAYGIFQELKVHDARAKALGYADRKSLQANVAVAIELYLEQGTAPWNASKSCWNKK